MIFLKKGLVIKPMLVFMSFFSFAFAAASCTLGPTSANFWQVMHNVEACVETGQELLSSQIDYCCSTLNQLDLIIKSEIESALTKIDSLGSQLSIMQSDIDNVSTKVDSVGSQVATVQSSLASCCVPLSALDRLILSDIDLLPTKIDSVSSSSSIRDTIIKSDIDSVSTKVDSVGSQAGMVQSSLAACCTTLSTLDRLVLSDIDSVSSKIDSASNSSSTRDTVLKSVIDTTSTNISSIGSQTAVIKSSLDACCSTVSTLDWLIVSDVDSVSTKANVLNTCMLGTRITQAMVPYTIAQPGHYYLCGSVSASGAPTITIAASNVTFDLNGFTISNTNNRGITNSGTLSNVTIKNGYITVSGGFRAIELATITNLTIKGIDAVSNGTHCVSLTSINNLIMKKCNGKATGASDGIQLVTIAGGYLSDVSMYNIPQFGFNIQSVVTGTTLEFVNCTADVALVGFVNFSATGTVICRSCAADSCFQGFNTQGGVAIFEDCVAQRSTSTFAGFCAITTADVVFKNCTAAWSSAGSGFGIYKVNRAIFEGCIAENNAVSGFRVDSTVAPGASSNCLFDNCLAKNNVTGFFIDASTTNTRITDCIASRNSGSGISNASASTIIVDTRSQRSATRTNPAYNLNGAVDVLGSASVVILS